MANKTKTETETKSQPDFSALLQTFKQECELNVCENSSTVRNDLDQLFASIQLSDICHVAQSFIAANADSFDKYIENVKQLSGRTICGVIAKAYYRCVTCQKHEAMCLCESCFEAGQHRQLNHKYYPFTSNGFSTCDCGDDVFMQLDGACPKHGRHGSLVTQANREPLDALLLSARRIVPRLLTRIVTHCRSKLDVQQLAALCDLLASLSISADVFIELIVSNLCDNDLYLSTVRPVDQDAHVPYSDAVQLELQSVVTSDVLKRVPERYRAYFEIKHSCLLDELVFWLIRLHFPHCMSAMLIANIPNLDFRLACPRSYTQQYVLFSVMHNAGNPSVTIPDQKSREVAQSEFTGHFSNNSVIASQLCIDEGLLERNLVSFALMFSLGGALEDCKLAPDTSAGRTLKVVDASHTLMLSKSYIGLTNDLMSILQHRSVAQYLVENVDLFTKFLDNVMLWQACLVMERTQNRSSMREGISARVFEGQLCTFSKPLFDLIKVLVRSDSDVTRSKIRQVSLTVTTAINRYMQHWLECIGLTSDQVPAFGSNLTDQSKLSFHIPLHRLYAAFLAVTLRLALPQHRKSDAQSDAQTGVDDTAQVARQQLEVLASSTQCYNMLQHVLDVLSGQFQITCSAWPGNRDVAAHLQIYRLPRSAFMYVDLDLLLTQICASQLDGDLFLKLLAEKFCAKCFITFFYFRRSSRNKYMKDPQAKLMLESLHLLLVWLLTCPTSWLTESHDTGETERVARQQLVCYLSCQDLTQAAVLGYLPPDEFTATPKLNSKAAEVLLDVATRSSDDASCKFVLKPEVWRTEYNPSYTYLRFGRDNFNNSRKRYYQRAGLSVSVPKAAQWPPLRVPTKDEFDRYLPFIKHWRFVNCSTFYSLIFVTLDHAIYYENVVTNYTVHFAVNLLCIALAYQEYSTGARARLDADYKPTSTDDVQDLQLENWYPASIVHEPLKCVVHCIGTVRTEIGTYTATCRVNRSILQLLKRLYRLVMSKRYVPRRADLHQSTQTWQFASGTSLASLLDALCQRSELIANSFSRVSK